MNFRIFLNKNVHANLSDALRTRGYDVIHAQEVERKGKTDLEQIDFAIKEKRCIFSFNVKDYVLLHNQLISNSINHYGIIVSKQKSFKETLSDLLSLLQNPVFQDIKNKIIYIFMLIQDNR